MLKLRNVQIMLCLVTFFLSADHACAEDWVFCSDSAIGAVYYSKSSIKKVSENIISLWTQNELNEEAKTKYFSILKSVDKAPANPDLITHVFELSEIDCVKGKIKDLSTIVYDEKGHALYSSPRDKIGEWRIILADSVAEKLKNIVCMEPAAPGNVAAQSAVADKNPEQFNGRQNEKEYPVEEAVKNLVAKWLNSWQSGDMKTYRSCYASDFKAGEMNLDAWAAYKAGMYRKSKNINIRIDKLQISVKKNNATAVFRQYYSSNMLKESGTKKLELRKINDEWKIYREMM